MNNDEENAIPKKLQERWEQHASLGMRACPHCREQVPAENLLCLYCGESTRLSVGVFGKLRSLITNPFASWLFLIFLGFTLIVWLF